MIFPEIKKTLFYSSDYSTRTRKICVAVSEILNCSSGRKLISQMFWQLPELFGQLPR
jgi:hypothetical protein